MRFSGACCTRLVNQRTGFGHDLNQTMFCALKSDRFDDRHCEGRGNVVPMPVGHQMEWP
jgi:hypothetical protein